MSNTDEPPSPLPLHPGFNFRSPQSTVDIRTQQRHPQQQHTYSTPVGPSSRRIEQQHGNVGAGDDAADTRDEVDLALFVIHVIFDIGWELL